jgi:histidyl-tRNA synthetase
MSEISAPKGVRDILPDESWKWDYVFGVLRKTAADFGFSEVHLPIFEHTELFSRGIGDTTDVVEKEMYTFTDKGGRSITLRPEATASMVRSYLEHRMGTLPQPVKMWCAGPMFRYERPQKGRYRQFWQVDFESLGSASPYADAEIIALSLEAFRRLGLSRLEVVINSVGCPACRPDYRRRLTEYFSSREGDLCETCRDRMGRNPLRILDCKKESCRQVTEDAPSVYESLCGECREHFDAVRSSLDGLGAVYRLDKRLVRGLDYYTKPHTKCSPEPWDPRMPCAAEAGTTTLPKPSAGPMFPALDSPRSGPDSHGHGAGGVFLRERTQARRVRRRPGFPLESRYPFRCGPAQEKRYLCRYGFQ